MDLLQDNKKKPTKTPAQKIVLALLIISIVLCIIIGIVIAYLSLQGEKKPYTLMINGKNINLNEFQLVDNNGVTYLSLRNIAEELGYRYYNGEYKIVGEGTDQGYIDNNSNIIQFSANSKKIYKTKEQSNKDYEYYSLENKIISIDTSLYIALDDLDIGLNLILNYSSEKNQTTVQTPGYWVEQNSEKLKEVNITISSSPENLKALSYGYAVINKNDKYGVTNLNMEELIGNKYNSIEFCEYTGRFISSNSNNEFGILTSTGLADINLQYDSIEILNYKPLLYKVERLDQYGIIDEKGNIINDILYDSIGYPENKNEKINYTLIIPSLNENIPESIVVYSNNKYGLLDLNNGKEVIPCILDGVYSVTKDEEIYYIIETQNNKMFLEDFIDKLNRVTVTID